MAPNLKMELNPRTACALVSQRRAAWYIGQADFWECEMNWRFVRLLVPVVVVSVLASGSIHAQESSTKAAQSSVEAWLSLIDNQRYAASWDTAASFFRNAITQEKWQTAVQAARAPLGQLKSRALKSASPTTTLPGAPDGEYVVFQFDATLERKAAAIETVTAIREKDGAWRVVGYFMK